MMDRDILVRDVGPRDGLQLVKTVLPTATKLDWIRADIAAGVPEIEVCSFVPPHVIAQFGDAVEVATAAASMDGCVMSALTPNLKGAQIGFQTGIEKINYVMSVSETHNQQNVRRTREESLDGFRAIIAERNAAAPGVKIGIGLATALGCTLEGRVPERDTLDLLEKVLDAGADEVMLPDTVGYANPTQVRSLFRKQADMPKGRKPAVEPNVAVGQWPGLGEGTTVFPAAGRIFIVSGGKNAVGTEPFLVRQAFAAERLRFRTNDCAVAVALELLAVAHVEQSKVRP